MPSQFFGLNIAYTGLLASNAAMNTTSNNIANVQTEGYSRQQVTQQASNALRVFQTYGCAGAGVETLAIERVRDEFYDGRFWDNNAQLGEYDMKQYYMQQLETYFDDDGKSTGFKTIFDQLMVTGMQALLKDPSSDTAKSQFVGYAGALTEYFNGMAGNLEKVQKDINQEIKLKVDEINSIAGEVATLNKQINTIELTGVKANELRDRRTLLIDELSKIVDVQVKETPIIDANNENRETGANRYMVKIAGGQMLVDGSDYNGLECVARTSYEKVNQTDIDGLYEVYWADGQKFNLYNASMGGDLAGLIQMRDGNNGENFTGQVTATGTTTTADGKTHDTVTVKVTKAYLQDLNKCNLSDQGGILDLGNQEFYYDSWEYTCEYDANGNATYSYTFTLSDSEKNPRGITNDRVGKKAEIGTDLSYQGIPYYMNQMNEWIRTFSQKFNDILTSGYSGNGDPGVKMFTGNKATGGEQFLLDDAAKRYDKQEKKAGSKMTVKVNDDSYYRLTAKNFDILEAIEQDPGLMANRKDAADGVEQNDLLNDLKNLATDKTKMSFRGCNASEFLQCILSDVALNASRANTFYASFKDISATIDNQRISISGVDEDEEAVNLVKYQNGYNLASKMIQTLTEIYDRLILETGV
ncbi:MAG: flagellar hook-associated protein FlgK [Lachnospiraceae bacterium]|uniref:Flagellar hook-associated protein 1 n=2 Tax=Waltera intestinalis TaxID=2606635 RepID=A0A6L5YLG7_9FIRM|nr:flagellar hook-associated protein FlgK [Waltera intestinalis]MCI6516106.1 flagellar hook-associated protein FlgK [Lachnospiraceae bacterium]MDY3656752.1 flagellar hook-associated protein FlgK [Lachnospiraceae bacterium]MST58858.1 flagellar hook-associated protein FlgK [Waltera intestinalis]